MSGTMHRDVHNRGQRKINEEKRREHMKKRKGKRHRQKGEATAGSILRTVILVIALAVFCYSGYQLLTIFSEYRKGSKEYQQIAKLAIKESKEKGENGESKFTVDFEALKAMNPDVVGWIRFDEPKEISYPVVHGRDNSEYLHRTFEASDNKLGTLFVDVNNLGDFSDKNTFIYGHNMKNGTMFAKLMEYKSKEYFDKNQFFYMYTPDGGVTTYQICAVSIIKDTSELYHLPYASAEEWQNYINAMAENSLYDTGVTVSDASQVVSLSTCTNVTDEERMLVQGVKVGGE